MKESQTETFREDMCAYWHPWCGRSCWSRSGCIYQTGCYCHFVSFLHFQWPNVHTHASHAQQSNTFSINLIVIQQQYMSTT